MLFVNLDELATVAILDAERGTWMLKLVPPLPMSPRHDPRVHFTGTHLLVFAGIHRKVVSPGGGCEGHTGDPGAGYVRGCDPYPATYEHTALFDGALDRITP